MMDLENDFRTEQLELKNDYEGNVVATLISSKKNQGNRKSVLYIHGFIDYFFHPHLAEEFNSNGFDFYAIDLRKYGRSILPHQHENYCKNVEEYFEEISMALKIIDIKSSDIYLMGHSTGGLIVSNYMNDGLNKELVNGVILNSPFLDFNQSAVEKTLSYLVSSFMASFSSYSNIDGVLSPVYAQSLHKDHFGEWNFNLNWKPIKGFPTYFKWILAIRTAQRKLKESKINVPVLLMHSSGSKKLKKFTEEANKNDIVLNIEDMKRVGKGLGKNVHFLEVENAVHDIFLSSEKVRNIAFKDMFSWLNEK